jgi:hypothetical protein
MNDKTQDDLQPSTEQLIYANLLLIGMWTGIFLLILTYFMYAAGILTPHVDMSLVTQYWGHGIHEYLAATNSPQGWGWVSLLGKGDFLNFVGLALLALMTILCYLVLVRGYIRQKDWLFSIICVLEVIVLSLAASGIFGAGGH